MQKTTKLACVIASVIATFALAFTLTGCGSSGSGGAAKDYSENFIGTWEIQHMEDPTTEGNLDEMIEMLKGYNAKLNVVFNEDKTVQINIATTSDDESMNGTWEAIDEKTARITIEGSSEDAVIDEEGNLTMERDGNELVCKKLTDEEAAAQQSDTSQPAAESSQPAAATDTPAASDNAPAASDNTPPASDNAPENSGDSPNAEPEPAPQE